MRPLGPHFLCALIKTRAARAGDTVVSGGFDPEMQHRRARTAPFFLSLPNPPGQARPWHCFLRQGSARQHRHVHRLRCRFRNKPLRRPFSPSCRLQRRHIPLRRLAAGTPRPAPPACARRPGWAAAPHRRSSPSAAPVTPAQSSSPAPGHCRPRRCP